MNIVRPLTDDGLFGFDEFGQLTHSTGPDEDGRTTYTARADVRGMTCMICQHGWEPTGPSIGDQSRWDLIGEHVHQSCLLRHTGLIERALVYRSIIEAKLRFKDLNTEPNGYWPQSDPYGKNKPWYNAELLDHPFKLRVGMRKNVWSIEVVAQGPSPSWSAAGARAEFENESVTKEFGDRGLLIHAWGPDKLREYIGRIAGLLRAAPKLAEPAQCS